MKIFKKDRNGNTVEAGKVRRQVESRVWVSRSYGKKKGAYSKKDRKKPIEDYD